MKKSNNEIKETENKVTLAGEVMNIFFQTNKAVKFNLCTFEKSKNGKQVYHFVPVKAFGDYGLEEGDEIKVTGCIATEKNEYNGKTTWETIVTADSITEMEN